MTRTKIAKKSTRIEMAGTEPQPGSSAFRVGVVDAGKESAGRAIATALVFILLHFGTETPAKGTSCPAPSNLELQLQMLAA